MWLHPSSCQPAFACGWLQTPGVYISGGHAGHAQTCSCARRPTQPPLAAARQLQTQALTAR